MKKPRRGGAKASKRWDLSDLASVLEDPRTHFKIGRVFKPDSNTEHWSLYKGEDGTKSMVMVEVETIPDSQDLTCRLATKPAWYIPKVGELVAVAVPDGEIDHCPLIVGILDTGAAPVDVSMDVMLIAPGRTWAVRSDLVQLGDTDADQSVILGDKRLAHEKSLMDSAMAACDLLRTAATTSGPLAPLVPGILALKNSFKAYKAAAPDDLSEIVKAK